ncbi:hypothetical protein OLQ14_01480 [Campylobacter jejuni]|nr:hypothetical protein [Campylobacter jejuni]
MRTKQGKNKQATGNAIERLGKNLTGIKAMLNHEKITPFVCFGWGCDFASDEKTVLAKLNVLMSFIILIKPIFLKLMEIATIIIFHLLVCILEKKNGKLMKCLK